MPFYGDLFVFVLLIRYDLAITSIAIDVSATLLVKTGSKIL